MKYFLLLITTLVFSYSKAQSSSVDSLVNIGIQYHDNGAYDLAIDKYKEAIVLEPKSALANYEIAMTYMYKGEYENALTHCDVVLEQKELYQLETYITKGSCLDYLGKTKESIKLFKKGIKKFGDNHLLYYNLGYNYYKMRDDEKAEEALINGINTNSSHASSHLLLGYLMSDRGLKSQSLLSLHYFLFLEPDTERAGAAYDLLREQFTGNVSEDPENNEITIYIDPNQKDSDFSAADLMVSMLQASRGLEENEGKTESELFIENTTSFFKVLGELSDDKKKGVWWEFYIPLYYELAQSDHMETYCKFISISTDQEATVWLRDNEAKVKAFAEWLNKL